MPNTTACTFSWSWAGLYPRRDAPTVCQDRSRSRLCCRFRGMAPSTTLVWVCAIAVSPTLWAATGFEQAQGLTVAPAPQVATPDGPVKSAVVTRIFSEIAIDGALDGRCLADCAEDWRADAERARDRGLTHRENGGHPPLRRRLPLHWRHVLTTRNRRESSALRWRRDANLGSDDRISILLDTYRDQRNAFYFATNPAGALVDGLVFANGQSNLQWDAIWIVRTRRTESRLERRVRHSLQEFELSGRADGLGLQHRSPHPAEARGSPLVRRTLANTVLSGIRSRRNHESE